MQATEAEGCTPSGKPLPSHVQLVHAQDVEALQSSLMQESRLFQLFISARCQGHFDGLSAPAIVYSLCRDPCNGTAKRPLTLS